MTSEHVTSSILILGPPPSSGLGGISEVLPSYEEAIISAGYYCAFHTVNDPRRVGGRTWLWIRNIIPLVKHILRLKQKGSVILYGHPGAGFSQFRITVLLFLGRMFGAYTLLHLHAGEAIKYLRNPWKTILFKISLFSAQRVIVLTPWWKRLLIEKGISQPLKIIPNPISNEFIREGQRAISRKVDVNKKKESINILVMTRLVAGKGLRETLFAMPLLPNNFLLTIAGTGPLQADLENHVDSLGIRKRVDFCGWSQGTKRFRLLEAADIYCMPSAIDSFGMGFIEAMAFGLPVIGFRWGPAPDIVRHGEVGLLVEKKTPQEIAAAILQYQSAGKRASVGRAGFHHIIRNYSTDVIGRDLSKVLEDLILGSS